MNNKIVIDVKNLKKSYKLYNNKQDRLKEAFSITRKKYHREFKALDNINFQLKQGDRLGVIGRNGSGKSTLLKLIANILPPSSGELKIVGNISALIELGAGFNPEFSGMENVYFYGTILGFSKNEIDEKIDEILSFADIGDFIHQPIKTYSSGMNARLAFSVAISVEPDILIIDEVLSVGDMFFKQKCINRLREMLDNGLTLFFVSHSIGEVKSLCNKALYLKNGKQIGFGDCEEICNLYQNESTHLDKKEKEKAIENTLKNTLSKEDNNVQILNITVNKLKSYYLDDPEFSKRLSNRSGNKEIEFKSLYFYNSNDKVINQFESFEKVSLKLSFVANENIPFGAAIGILCRDNKGNDIFAINSDLFDLYLPELNQGENYVFDLEVILPLVKGIYSLSVGAKPNPNSDYFYDRCFNATVFEVTKPKWQKETGGIIYQYAKNYTLHT